MRLLQFLCVLYPGLTLFLRYLCSYNRSFRYEERDDKGYVKGRYGFFDRYGKLKVVNYSADPYKGFHAEGAHVH